MGLHDSLTNMAPCNIKKCCCCCELCSIPICVLVIGILTAIDVPFSLMKAIQSTGDWEQVSDGPVAKCTYVPDAAEEMGFNYKGFSTWL